MPRAKTIKARQVTTAHAIVTGDNELPVCEVGTTARSVELVARRGAGFARSTHQPNDPVRVVPKPARAEGGQ